MVMIQKLTCFFYFFIFSRPCGKETTKITMKFLGLNKKHFVWLNLYPNEALDGKVKYLPLVCAALMILLELSALISSALFIYRNFEEDIRNSFFALFQLIAFLKIICMWIVAYNNRAKLFNIFKIFQEIYDSSKFGILKSSHS